MLQSKKSQINAYLRSLTDPTAFDHLLSDTANKTMESRLRDIGLSHIDIHTGWHPQYRCIDIRARHGDYYLDIQIEPDTYSFAADLDEPDEGIDIPLVSADAFYKDVLHRIKSL